MRQPTEQYTRELEELKNKFKVKREQSWNFLTHLVKMDVEQLKHCGYKDMESALSNEVIKTEREIERMIVAFEKKFPN